MSKEVMFKGSLLKKGSEALELYAKMQAANGKEKEELRKKLDMHANQVYMTYVKMHGEFPKHLINYKVGNDYATATQE